MPIKAILFDVGGVLFTSLDTEEAARRYDALAAELGMKDGQAMWNHFYGGDEWQAAKTGAIVDAEMWRLLLAPHGYDTAKKRRAFVAHMYAVEGVQPEMKQLLATLYSRFPLGILSNASDVLEELLERRGVAHYFTTVVNSHRVGVAKPERAAFEIAIERLGVPAEAIYFTDDQERNTRAAASLDMTVHRFESVERLRADMERHRLL